MIHVTVCNDNTSVRPYPKLMINDGMIVLFYESGFGTVLKSGSLDYSVGYRSNSWIMSKFVDFEGQITLENTKVS